MSVAEWYSGTTELDIGLSVDKDILTITTAQTCITTGKVCIGSTSTDGRVDIFDTASAGTTLPSLGSAGSLLNLRRIDGIPTLSIGFVSQNNGDFYLQAQRTDGATASKLLLNPNGGNVGVGVTDPSYLFHVVGVCAASTFTDLTPFPAKNYDALSAIALISAGIDGQLDHSTLPDIARCEPMKETKIIDGKEVIEEKPSRNIGMSVSINTVAIQQLHKLIIDMSKRLELIEERLNKLVQG